MLITTFVYVCLRVYVYIYIYIYIHTYRYMEAVHEETGINTWARVATAISVVMVVATVGMNTARPEYCA